MSILTQERKANGWYEVRSLENYVVATLKLCVKSRKPPRCDHTVFQLKKLKELTYAQEYAVTVSDWFGALDTLEDPEELWETFKCETLEGTNECTGECLRS